MLDSKEIKQWSGKDIRAFRQAYGLSQTKLAEVLGIKFQLLSMIERGVRKANRCVCILLTMYEKELYEKKLKGG